MEETDAVKLPCADKIAFDSKKQAEATATTSAYWYGTRPHAYRCSHCGLWHLSTTSPD
ncbi:MAG: hypothetical protein WBP03_05095 [Candidatus Saccharimonadales bacterium]